MFVVLPVRSAASAFLFMLGVTPERKGLEKQRGECYLALVSATVLLMIILFEPKLLHRLVVIPFCA